jgi:CheY-like chemotaxis protein
MSPKVLAERETPSGSSEEAKYVADILVVDDDRDVCNALVKLLSAIGHTASGAYSGADALRAVAQARQLPDLVILDQMMEGIEGLEVLRQLRADPRTAGLRVVIFSAVTDPDFQRRALSAGATACWPKTELNYLVLAHRIDELVGAAPPSD